MKRDDDKIQSYLVEAVLSGIDERSNNQENIVKGYLEATKKIKSECDEESPVDVHDFNSQC